MTPVLREHPEDIPLIAEHFWGKITGGKGELTPEVIRELCRHKWPGNSRELKRVLEHLFSIYRTSTPTLHNLQMILADRLSDNVDEHISGNEIDIHRARCLIHLNRSYEVIHTYRHKIRVCMSKKDSCNIRKVGGQISFFYHEMDELCKKPLRFHNNSVFSSVHDLKGKIFYLQNLLFRKENTALSYMEREMLGTMDRVLKSIFMEIEKIMAEG
jgi:hypothetical protein